MLIIEPWYTAGDPEHGFRRWLVDRLDWLFILVYGAGYSVVIGYNLVFISQNQNPYHLCGPVGATLLLYQPKNTTLALFISFI